LRNPLNSILIEGRICSAISDVNSSMKSFRLEHNRVVKKEMLFPESYEFLVLTDILPKKQRLLETDANIRVVGRLEQNALGICIIAEHIERKGG
jgi:hypothetical protein